MSPFVSWSQKWIKAALPRPVLHRIRVYRHRASVRKWEAQMRERAAAEWRLMLRNWEKQGTPNPPDVAADPTQHRVLVFPSDPGAIVGSRGDDAMITAVVQSTRSIAADAEIEIFCDPGGERIALQLGFRPVPIGADPDFAPAVARLLAQRRYASYFAVGADIVDGRFGPRIPALMLIAADLAARAGVPASVLGSSFGKDPAPALKEVFGRLDPRVRLNIRDPISMRRIQAFAPVRPRLVADAAFALAPGKPDAAAAAWIAQQRAAGRKLVGVNVHPMLVRDADAAWVEAMAVAMAEALGEVGSRRGVAWILLPHDYREHFGDLACLRRLDELLRGHGGAQVLLLAGEQDAADLKALVGALDAVITGRMHLAIAALGMGVPTLGLTYHDKFEGLYEHFDLPQSLLLSPAVLPDAAQLARHIDDFVEDAPALAARVARRREAVIALARRNFDDENPTGA
jgi:polysaccharide pyruvyl transferase WcaK-like protein